MHTDAGISPARMSRPNAWQPRQNATIDSSPAATTSSASSTSAAVVAPASTRIPAAVVKAAPMPWANRLGGPGTYFGRPSRGAATRIANRPRGLRGGPVSTRAQKP